MNILEKEIEELIHEVADACPDHLRERGLYVPDNAIWYRQLDLGDYGRADLVAIQITPKMAGRRDIWVDIYELKKDQVNAGTLLQSFRYAKGIYKIINSKLKKCSIHFNFSLVGKKVEAGGDFIYTPDFISNVFFYEYVLDFYNGMRFKQIRGLQLKNARLPAIYQFLDDAKEHLLWKVNPPRFPIVMTEDIDDLPF